MIEKMRSIKVGLVGFRNVLLATKSNRFSFKPTCCAVQNIDNYQIGSMGPSSILGAHQIGYFSQWLNMERNEKDVTDDDEGVYVAPYVNPDDLHPDRPIFDGHIPREKLHLSFSRSSGPGGQNVNKVNTKVDIRLNIDDADWLPDIVKERLKEIKANKINKEGELIIQAQSFRTQEQNIKDAIHRLKGYIEEAYNIPKEWKPREGRTEKGDAIRMKDKKHHSDKKQRRQEGKRIKNIYDY